MGLFGGGNSKSTSENNQRQTTASGGSSVVDFSGDVTGAGASVSITDGGAIAGNTQVANNALKTAETITKNISDSLSGQQKTFAGAIEGLKKAELTGGGSLFFDALKYWPVIPVALILMTLIKRKV